LDCDWRFHDPIAGENQGIKLELDVSMQRRLFVSLESVRSKREVSSLTKAKKVTTGLCRMLDEMKKQEINSQRIHLHSSQKCFIGSQMKRQESPYEEERAILFPKMSHRPDYRKYNRHQVQGLCEEFGADELASNLNGTLRVSVHPRPGRQPLSALSRATRIPLRGMCPLLLIGQSSQFSMWFFPHARVFTAVFSAPHV
jgi:hypothetical protein